MSSHIKQYSIVECQNSICNEKVRLKMDFIGSLKTFRCGACMPCYSFNAENPKSGDYTRCVICYSQFRYNGGMKRCYVCS